MIFPNDFEKKPHLLIPGVYQWLCKNSLIRISIVGGPMTYGDGINTFEMMIDDNDVEGYLSMAEINERIKDLPKITEIIKKC